MIDEKEKICYNCKKIINEKWCVSYCIPDGYLYFCELECLKEYLKSFDFQKEIENTNKESEISVDKIIKLEKPNIKLDKDLRKIMESSIIPSIKPSILSKINNEVLRDE